MITKLTRSGLLTRDVLTKMVKTYRDGLHDNETTSCLIPFSAIEELIKHYSDLNTPKGQNPIEGFRIYFHRPDPFTVHDQPGKSINTVDGGKGQMSIILAPVNNYREIHKGDDIRGSADDMFIENGECLVFIPGGEHTGLCPKNCDGSI